jgi:hypothetical protein
VCDLETSRIGAPYVYDVSSLRVQVGKRQGDNEKETGRWLKLYLKLKAP